MMNFKTFTVICAALILSFGDVESRPHSVCVEWIQPFWELIVLREDRPAIFQDLARFFIFLDHDGSGKVDEPEFGAGWQQATLMADTDVHYLFVVWSILKDRTDPEFIVDPNIRGIWEEMDEDNSDSITMAEFEAWWIKELETMPAHGCPQ